MSTLTKRKAPATLAAPYVKTTTKRPTKTTIDETRTSVSGTEALQNVVMETIEISSDADNDEDISDDEEKEDERQQHEKSNGSAEMGEVAHLNGENLPPARQVENTQLDDEEDAATSPSFGELLRGNTGDAIDLTVMLRQPATDAVIHTEPTAMAPPTHQSLATVLSQALSTDDTDLLESCLNTTDLPTIKNTIERIDSALAGTLLHKLAARLHRRPGRAGTLMTWVQWTLVAHGGALASQGKVVHSLSGLQKVLADRAKGLTSLLALKGKLDILEGQMELRRKMQQKSMDKRMMIKDEEEVEQSYGGGGDDDEEEEDVVYVEGEENDAAALTNGILSRRIPIPDTDDAAVLANGGFNDDDDDDDEEDDDSDDTASEDQSAADDAEALDEDEVNYDDVDESMGEEEESDVEAAAPPAKMQKVAKSFNKKN